MSLQNTYLVISKAGSNRDLSKGSREQRYWNEHGAFIDGLVEEGFMFMGGPLVDEGGAMIIVRAENEAEVREKLRHDPWYEHDILMLDSIKRWDIFVDERD